MTIPHAAMVERAERLLAAVEGMTPGPWEWWTSNSVKRLSAIGDGDVMYSYPHSSGTDIAIREPDMRGITLLRNEAPTLIRSLLQALEAERGDLRLTIQTSMRLAAMLEKIVRAADRNPFCSVGHVIEHVVPEARAEFPPLSDEEPQGPSSLELKTGG